MASHNITIAKAAFTAACLRHDNPRLDRDDLSSFHVLLGNIISNCSHSNVEKCKLWILEKIAPSLERVKALSKYLALYTKYLTSKSTEPSEPDGGINNARAGLHILYLMHDLLHHVKYHTNMPLSHEYVRDGFQAYLVEIYTLAKNNTTRVNRKVNILLDIWKRHQYFDDTLLSRLTSEAGDDQSHPADAQTISSNVNNNQFAKETAYIMPSTHGDPSLAYYDLPAANLMPHIIPNKPFPMRSSQIKALQLSAGVADESLVHAVKDFLKDIERIDDPYHDIQDDFGTLDMDELGQISSRNEADEIVGDSYYGWSREFCAKMNNRGKSADNSTQLRGRPRSISGTYSSSRSRTHSTDQNSPKRRRYSRSRSHSSSQQRYRSESRSRSPPQKNIPLLRAYVASATQAHNVGMEVPFSGGLAGNLPLHHTDATAFGPLPHPPPPPPRPLNYNGPWPPPPPPPPQALSFTLASTQQNFTNPTFQTPTWYSSNRNASDR